MADGDATLQRKCEELEDELRTVTAQVHITRSYAHLITVNATRSLNRAYPSTWKFLLPTSQYLRPEVDPSSIRGLLHDL